MYLTQLLVSARAIEVARVYASLFVVCDCMPQHLLEHLQETEPLSDDIKKEIFDHIVEMEKVRIYLT